MIYKVSYDLCTLHLCQLPSSSLYHPAPHILSASLEDSLKFLPVHFLPLHNPSSCPHSWCLLLSDLAELFWAQQSIWLLFQEIVSNTAVNINTYYYCRSRRGEWGKVKSLTVGMFKLPYSVQWEPGVIFKSYHFLLLFGQVKSLNFVESHFLLFKREY